MRIACTSCVCRWISTRGPSPASTLPTISMANTRAGGLEEATETGLPGTRPERRAHWNRLALAGTLDHEGIPSVIADAFEHSSCSCPQGASLGWWAPRPGAATFTANGLAAPAMEQGRSQRRHWVSARVMPGESTGPWRRAGVPHPVGRRWAQSRCKRAEGERKSGRRPRPRAGT